jgi:hypothetical protein
MFVCQLGGIWHSRFKNLWAQHRPDLDLSQFDISPTVRCYDSCYFDGTLFRTASSQAAAGATRTDNSGVMMQYSAGAGARGERKDAYGRLLGIMEHRLWEDGPVLVFAEIQWYTQSRTLFDGRVQIVRSNPADRWNTDATGYRYDRLDSIYPVNVIFEPLAGDIWDLSGELMAVYRETHMHLTFA